jgi:hypothetical protein
LWRLWLRWLKLQRFYDCVCVKISWDAQNYSVTMNKLYLRRSSFVIACCFWKTRVTTCLN